MTNQLATTEKLSADAVERALILQDLSGMKPEDRLQYYKSVCESLGLNPLTRPFAYISLNGKLTLYALKDCTEQLRKIHNISIEIVGREAVDGVYVVTARATNGAGRKDESIGAVPFENLRGEAKANALMKTETKAKRRVTLSICGLGILDETEVASIPNALPVDREEEAKKLVLAGGDNIPLPGNGEEALERKREELRQKSAQGPLEGATDVHESQPDSPVIAQKPAQEPRKRKSGVSVPPEPSKSAESDKWEDYVISQVKLPKFTGRKLSELTKEEVASLHEGWVIKFADKIKGNPAKELEAKQIAAAHSVLSF